MQHRNRVRLKRIGGNGLKMLVLSLLGIAFTGGLSWLTTTVWLWREARRYPDRVDGGHILLVPGMRLSRCAPGRDFQMRLTKAERLWREQRRPIAILGGSTSPGCPRSEAEAGREFLAARGVGGSDLTTEDHSRHTLENLRYARELFGTQGPFVVISNRYHLPRLCLMARRLGLSLIPCAAETGTGMGSRGLGRVVVEAFFVHWYLTGLGWAALVGDKASLARIS